MVYFSLSLFSVTKISLYLYLYGLRKGEPPGILAKFSFNKLLILADQGCLILVLRPRILYEFDRFKYRISALSPLKGNKPWIPISESCENLWGIFSVLEFALFTLTQRETKWVGERTWEGGYTLYCLSVREHNT